MKKFRFIEHTGDIGVLIFGENLETLFIHASQSLSYILTNPKQIKQNISHKILIKADNIESLLISFLNELIFLFDTKGFIFNKCNINSLNDNQVDSDIFGETFDETQHIIKTTIKSATYHKIKLIKENMLWKVQVIFDI